MSTKIYNGFRIKSLSTGELIVFKKDLAEKIKPYIYESFCETTAIICRKIINQCIDLNIEFGTSQDIKKIEEKLKEWHFLNSPQKSFLCRNDFEKVLSELTFPISGDVLYLSINIFKTLLMPEFNYLVDFYFPVKDVRTEIAFLQGDRSHDLFIAYGDEFCKALRTLIEDDKPFCEKYGLEEYGYWNNVDQPENVTDTEWDCRRKDWDKALPTGIPAEDGFSITEIIPSYVLFSYVSVIHDGRRDKILSLLPSVDDILEQRAADEAIEHFVDNDPSNNGKKWSVIYELTEMYKELMKKKDAALVSYKEDIKRRLKENAPSLSIEEILNGSILELIPTYYKFKKDPDNKHLF